MRILLKDLRIPAENGSSFPASILIEDGIIIALPSPAENVPADRIEHLGNALVLPAAIDAHVHFDDPGYTHREDFLSGTRAAAAGGVGLVVDMPCTSIPEVTTVENLHKKLQIISPKAVVDFMLWGGLSGQCLERPDWREEAEALAAEGVAAFKCYMISGMESFRALDASGLGDVLAWARSAGIPVGVHAEDPEVIAKALEKVGKINAVTAYAASRPAACEESALRKLIELNRVHPARLHIVHLAAAPALRLVEEAQREGLPLSAETCPHYLLFTVEDLERMNSLLKTAPVVKSAADREALWNGLDSGSLLYVASDHAAAQYPEEKETGSVWTDYGGIPGVELLLPTLYSEGYRAGRISLSRLVEITSSAPAGFLGLGGRKGKLAPGYDADFAVIDEEDHVTVRAGDLHNRNRYTPLEGRLLEGRVIQTWVRGRRVYRYRRDGRDEFGAPGGGKWIRRGAVE